VISGSVVCDSSEISARNGSPQAGLYIITDIGKVRMALC
jgi:hypothetical protein